MDEPPNHPPLVQLICQIVEPFVTLESKSLPTPGLLLELKHYRICLFLKNDFFSENESFIANST